jgi:hypothetical protein
MRSTELHQLTRKEEEEWHRKCTMCSSRPKIVSTRVYSDANGVEGHRLKVMCQFATAIGEARSEDASEERDECFELFGTCSLKLPCRKHARAEGQSPCGSTTAH